jgi:CRISPR/Cas system-associated exonuclease Cas4 (RecB family)
MFIEKVVEYKQSKSEQWPVVANRASEMGHPCVRYLVLNRTHWQEKTLPDPRLLLVFDLGNILETAVIRDLRDAGVNVNEQQRAFQWKEYQITGSIDGTIVDGRKVYPLEIKSCSPFVFDKLNSITDMVQSRYLYMRKYPTQLNLYMLMKEQETALFIFKNKVSGAMKEIWMDLDYNLGEQTLQKAETINHHVEAGTLPEPIEWEDSICSECGYLHVCNPVRTGKEVEILDDEEMLELLIKRESLQAYAKEFEEIDSVLKERLEGRDKLLIGDYYITGSWRKRTRYDVPKDIKEQYKTESQYWVRKIAKITEQAKKEAA